MPDILGEDLIKQLEDQARGAEPSIVSDQLVESFDKLEDGTFVLHTHTGEKHYTKKIIVATGIGIFDMVPLETGRAKFYEGKNLHYTINDLKKFAGKTVMISSNSRVGVDWALALEPLAAKVYLTNKDESFKKTAEQDLDKLSNSQVEVRMSTTVSELHGDDEKIHEVSLENVATGNLEGIRVDDLLVYHGVSIDSGPMKDWGLNMEKSRIPVDGNMSTSIDGIYVAGDVANYTGKTTLIASGFAEAMSAVNSIKASMNPKAPSQVYSTVIYRNKK